MKRIIAVICMVLLVFAFISSGCPAGTTTPTEPEVEVIEWRHATWDPPFDCFSQDLAAWGERLEEATDGRMIVNFYWSESLVKMIGSFDAVAAGTADTADVAISMLPERFPISNSMCGILYAYTHQTQEGKTYVAMQNKYKELRDEFLPTRVLWWDAPPPDNLIISRTKQVKTMEDLKGMKIRMTAPELIKMYQILGAVPVPISVTELYHALETGIVDASSSEPNELRLWKNYEVTKYRTDTGGTRGRGKPKLVNVASYNNLPADIKEIFDEVTDPLEMTILVNKHHEEFIQESLQIILEHDKEVGNPPFYVLPQEERERWKQLVQPVNEELMQKLDSKGLPGKAFVEDAIAFAEEYLDPEWQGYKYD